MTPTLSIEAFLSLASVGEDVLMHTAIVLALKSDRRSLTNLFKAAVLNGPGQIMSSNSDMTLQLLLWDVSNVKSAAALEPQPSLRLTKGVTFQKAIAAALGENPEGPCSVPRVSDQKRLNPMNPPVSMTSSTLPWNDDSRDLLAAAIDVWRPAQPGHSSHHLQTLLAEAIATANHPGVVQTFLDAGLGERELWLASDFETGGVMHPFEQAVSQGNVFAASLLLSALNSEQGTQALSRMVSTMSLGHELASLARFMPMTTSDASVERPMPCLGEAALALIDDVHAKVDDEAAMMLRSSVLIDYLGMWRCADRTPQTIDRLLTGTPPGRMSLSDCLGEWARIGGHLSVSEPLKNNLRQLIGKALQVHVVPVVQAAMPMIRAALQDDTVLGSDGGRTLEQICLLEYSEDSVHVPDFVNCLGLLDNAGRPVKGTFEIDAPISESPGRLLTSVLHLLAESKHPDKVSAMAAALNFGCPSQFKDHRGRTPTSAVEDRESRALWDGIHRSFLSAEAARKALSEIETPAPHAMVPGVKSGKRNT